MQDATAALSEAQRLVQAGSFAAAVEVLEDVVDREPTLGVLYLLAAACLELGEDDKALRYASAAVESDPSSAPARDVLAKVHLGLRDYVAALSDFEAVAILAREQRQAPPSQFSIPAHFALHNVEQLDHILSSNRDGQAPPVAFNGGLAGLRRELTDVIDGANGEVPWYPSTPATATCLPIRRS